MTVALEPMVLAGSSFVKVLDDRWTVVSSDGKLTGHFEHTIAITDGEPEILTLM
jgi:methionyl aminopeptidase